MYWRGKCQRNHRLLHSTGWSNCSSNYFSDAYSYAYTSTFCCNDSEPNCSLEYKYNDCPYIVAYTFDIAVANISSDCNTYPSPS